MALPFSVAISSLKTRQLGSSDGPCGRSELSHLQVYWISSHMVSEESRGRKDSVYDCLWSFFDFQLLVHDILSLFCSPLTVFTLCEPISCIDGDQQ